jgi:hypothetical protein
MLANWTLYGIKLKTVEKVNFTTHLWSFITKWNKRGPLNFNLLSSSVVKLNHKMEKVWFPQICWRLLGEFCPSNATPEMTSYYSLLCSSGQVGGLLTNVVPPLAISMVRNRIRLLALSESYPRQGLTRFVRKDQTEFPTTSSSQILLPESILF